METDQTPSTFEAAINKICKIFNAVAAGMLFLLMVLGATDVIGRYLFNAPINGTMERGQILLGLMVFLSWGYTQIKKGHVNVELFVMKFPPRLRSITNFITTLLMLLFMILIVWQSTLAAIDTHNVKEVIYVIHWPLAPFMLFVPIGGIFLCLVLMMELMQHFVRIKGRS